jgi:2-polyprenyl-3-methyl-5-hydroxy-6-metoxy-1,4-benzoquinol methylase
MQCPSCGFAFLDPMPDEDTATDTAVGQSYIDNYDRRLEKKMRRSLKRARRLARRMKGPRLLDVGSNVGIFCEAARQIGLEPVGLEPNAPMVEAAERQFPENTFISGRFEEADLGEARFDGLYCSEVIEHVPEVNPFVANLARVLKPGGVMFLTTPDLGEYAKGGNPDAWRDFGAPDHKLYFNRRNIRIMLEKHGFERVRVAFNFGKGIKLFATRG